MWRNVRPNERTSHPTHHVVFDTETVPVHTPERKGAVLHTLRLGVAIAFRCESGVVSRVKELRFKDDFAFWEFIDTLLSQTHPLHVWAHNLPFDLTAVHFWDFLADGTFSVDEPADRLAKRAANRKNTQRRRGMVVTEDPPTIIKVFHRSGCLVTFLDTMNFFPMPLAKLGESVCLPKLPMPPMNAHDSMWFPYCRRDVEILQMTVARLLRFIAENDLGNFKPTAAGQAMASFRHRFMRHTITCHDYPEARQLERESYFGGMCDCFYVGPVGPQPEIAKSYNYYREQYTNLFNQPKLCHLDCNSMYPSVMKGNEYPIKLGVYAADPKQCQARKLAATGKAIASVQIRSDTEPYPVRVKQETFYCVGTFVTSLAGPELKRAVDSGHVLDILEIASYQTAPIFDSYVDYFWEMRQQAKTRGDAAYDLFAKTLLCSLYGKWAQKVPKWIDLPDVQPVKEFGYWHDCDLETGEWITYRGIGGLTQQMSGRGEKEGTFIAISAFVTAYGREKMRAARLIAGDKNVYYQGVDSLIVNEQGRLNLLWSSLIDQGELGKFRVKGVHKSAYFHGPNDYELDGVRTRAGMKGNATLIDGGSYVQERFLSLDSMLAAADGPEIVSKLDTLPPEGEYRRRKVQVDGWTVPRNFEDFA